MARSAVCLAPWLLALVASVTGCVLAVAAPPSSGVVASGPPPAPLMEGAPRTAAPPIAGAIWIPGYWHWTGIQYSWIPGHWDVARRAGRWIPPRYVLRDGVYYYEPGGWVAR